MLIERLDYSSDQFIDALKRAESRTIELVVILDLGIILLNQLTNPIDAASLHGS